MHLHAKGATAVFKTIDIDKVGSTIERLKMRIAERFPDSGLLQVAGELHEICNESAVRNEFISQPQVWLRILVGGVIVFALVMFGFAMIEIRLTEESVRLTELVATSEALMNMIVLIGAAVFFLLTVETRIKRQRALQGLHQLRSITHVIDMHQLTKDPVMLTSTNQTSSSPPRSMTYFELGRYLDYCSELLSLTGKLAAITCQAINDREVVASANEIELLTTELSRKVWQKIAQLNAHHPPGQASDA